MYTVRNESPGDHEAVHAVTVAAFAASEFGHNGEAEIVERIRSSNDSHVSLVAVDGDEVIGHILFSPATIQTADGVLEGMGLGPMSVEPGRQRQGIGKVLIEAGIQQLNSCPFIMVFGHADYYPRFGFVPASEYGIRHAFEGMPQELFFIRWSEEPRRDGVAFYHAAFGPQTG